MDKMIKVTNFSDVAVNDKDCYLIVRVLKAWTRASYSNPRQPYSMEMILLDEQDNKITASCLARYLYRFQALFVEQRVLSIRKPIFGESGGPWRYVENPLKVGFNTDTVVAQVNQWNGSEFGFSFINFQSVLDMTAPEDLSIDLIGMVVSSSSKKYKQNKKQEDSVRVTIKIQDLSGRQIYVTLFDSYCSEICNYICEHLAMKRFVVVLQFAKFSVYNGRHSVTNAFGGTKLFINSDHVGETNNFRERFDDIFGDQADEMISSISTNITYTLENDFMNVTDFMQTAEIDSVKEHKYLIVLGTIKLIDSNWCYEACTICNKMVQTRKNKGKQVSNDFDNTQRDKQLAVVTETGLDVVDELYFCKNVDCGEFEREVKTFKRLKVTLMVQDSSGTVDLTMLDAEAKRVLRKSALDIVLPSPPKDADGNLRLPADLEALIGKKYAFKVEVSDFNIFNKYKVYTIVKTCDDQHIIGALENKHNLNQTMSIGTITCDSQDSRYEENSVKKDLSDKRSHTKVDEASSSKFNNVPLKRKLTEVYDLEDGAGSSPTKEDDNFEGKEVAESNDIVVKEKILVPKIEK